MAKKQTNPSTISANIAAAAAAAVREETAILSTKRASVAKKHAKAKVADVFVTAAAVESPVLVEKVLVFEQAAPVAAEKPSPDHEKIAELAYLYWEARGCQGGYEQQVQDWLRAETALQS